MSDHTFIMAEIKFADVTTIMRSIIRLIVMGRLCELCVILLVDSMLVYVFLRCMLFYAVAECVEKVGSVGPGHSPTRPQFYSGARPWLGCDFVRNRDSNPSVSHQSSSDFCTSWLVNTRTGQITQLRSGRLIGFFSDWPPLSRPIKSPIGAKIMGRYCGQTGRSLGSDAVPVDKVTALTLR
jgi:hypothetical protein